jgi:hypothetical protein
VLKLVDLPEAREIASRLVNIKAELGQLGLFKTMHALDTATKAIGYEIEEHLQHHARVERSAQP